MANTILLKRSSTPGNVPPALGAGEVGINLSDGLLFYGTGSSVENLQLSSINLLGDVDTTTKTPILNEVLAWDGSKWVPTYVDGAGGGSGAVASVFGRTGNVSALVGDYTATQISYDNTTSGLPYSDLQNLLDYITDYQENIVTNGYRVTPSGLTFQWGQMLDVSAGGGTVIYPITFPSACFAVMLTKVGNPAQVNLRDDLKVYTFNASSFDFTLGMQFDATTDLLWFAIGN